MERGMTRRQAAKTGALAAGSMVVGVPRWALATMSQEQEVPFTDMPDGFETDPTAIVRFVDIRRIDEFFTPADEFFTIQHYGQPDIDAATHAVEISGLVTRPQALSVADIRRRPRTEIACAFECSGNSRRRFNGLISNGLWGGTSLRAMLDDVGVETGRQGSRVLRRRYRHGDNREPRQQLAGGPAVRPQPVVGGRHARGRHAGLRAQR